MPPASTRVRLIIKSCSGGRRSKTSSSSSNVGIKMYLVQILVALLVLALINEPSSKLASGQLEAVGAVLSVVPVTSILATAGLVGVKLAALSRLLQALGYDRAYLAQGGPGTAAQPIGLHTNYAYMFPYVPGLNISVKGEHDTYSHHHGGGGGSGASGGGGSGFMSFGSNGGGGGGSGYSGAKGGANRKTYPAMGLPGDYEQQTRPFRGSETLKEIFKEAGIKVHLPNQNQQHKIQQQFQQLVPQGNGLKQQQQNQQYLLKQQQQHPSTKSTNNNHDSTINHHHNNYQYNQLSPPQTSHPSPHQTPPQSIQQHQPFDSSADAPGAGPPPPPPPPPTTTGNNQQTITDQKPIIVGAPLVPLPLKPSPLRDGQSATATNDDPSLTGSNNQASKPSSSSFPESRTPSDSSSSSSSPAHQAPQVNMQNQPQQQPPPQPQPQQQQYQYQSQPQPQNPNPNPNPSHHQQPQQQQPPPRYMISQQQQQQLHPFDSDNSPAHASVPFVYKHHPIPQHDAFHEQVVLRQRQQQQRPLLVGHLTDPLPSGHLRPVFSDPPPLPNRPLQTFDDFDRYYFSPAPPGLSVVPQPLKPQQQQHPQHSPHHYHSHFLDQQRHPHSGNNQFHHDADFGEHQPQSTTAATATTTTTASGLGDGFSPIPNEITTNILPRPFDLDETLTTLPMDDHNEMDRINQTSKRRRRRDTGRDSPLAAGAAAAPPPPVSHPHKHLQSPASGPASGSLANLLGSSQQQQQQSSQQTYGMPALNIHSMRRRRKRAAGATPMGWAPKLLKLSNNRN